MKIGLLITSFLQGKLNLTTTSTIFSPYVDHAMEESRTAYFNGSLGEILGIARGRVKTGGGAYWASQRPKLLKLRRKHKPKHRGTLIRYGWRSQLLWIRLSWRSHWKPQLQNKIANMANNGKRWWK
jgi:hypothetical protein